MGKTVFIPLTDDLLYEHPERILGPVIPFSQQARRAAAEPVAFRSTIPGLDAKAKLEAAGTNAASRSKPAKASLPQGASLRSE